jgi:hypothetical protein
MYERERGGGGYREIKRERGGKWTREREGGIQ